MTKSDNASELVFVYGTLRRGGSNAFRMEGADFVGEGFVRGCLYTISWYPGLVLDDGPGKVRGEVFRVGPGLLRKLDEFEGLSAGEIEGSEYRRLETRIYLNGVATDEVVFAWAYDWTGPVDEANRIASGDWLDVVQPAPFRVFSTLGFAFTGFAVLIPLADWWVNSYGVTILLSVGSQVGGLVSFGVGKIRGEKWSRARSIGVGLCTALLVVYGFFAAVLLLG